MEEMNNVIENGAVEIVEEVAEKLTFGQNVAAYALAGTFVVGIGTVGYLGYKGVKALVKTIKNKKEIVDEASDEEVVDIEKEDIHEVKDDESEQN